MKPRKHKHEKKRRLKVGLALGGGSARGLAHIGVLKTLHKHKIYPDYVAGTSMGAVIGALYAADHSPEEIEEIATTTNWKEIVDFTVPKAGLIKGEMIERRIRRLVHKKEFKELNFPLNVVAYNFDKNEKVVFSSGDVARAVRASISIPGIFAPLKIDSYRYIDGGVVDPTPFDIVKEMGADIIIAVDLFSRETRTVRGPKVKGKGILLELREKFIAEELFNIKNYIIPTRWPGFARKMILWLLDKLLYPAKVLKIIAGKELPPIAKVMSGAISVLTNNLAKERIDKADIDIKITPSFGSLSWSNFDKVEEFVKIGEKAMENEVGKLRRKLTS